MKLRHFSPGPITTLRPIGEPPEGRRRLDKPFGFWISDEDDHGWKSWCEGEEFSIENLQYQYEVVLADDGNVLTLTTLDELWDFNQTYRLANSRPYSSYIDWPRLVEKCQGILITPYQWKLRLHDEFFWYYGWDCASGCIWDITAIADLRLISAPIPKELTQRPTSCARARSPP